MRIIKVQSCWTCPMRKAELGLENKSWCTEVRLTFDLRECPKDDVIHWCPLEDPLQELEERVKQLEERTTPSAIRMVAQS